MDGRRYERRVGQNGSVTVEASRYDVGEQLAGQYVVLQVAAADKALLVPQRQRAVTRLPRKELRGAPLPLPAYVALLRREARSRRHAARRSTLSADWAT